MTPKDGTRPLRERTVKPRTLHTDEPRDLIVVSDDEILRGRDNTSWPRGDLPLLIRTEPPSLLVAQGCNRILYELNRVFKDNPQWQFKLMPLELSVSPMMMRGGNKGAITRDRDSRVAFLGFKGLGKDSPGRHLANDPNRKNRYHHTLDPVTYGGKNIWQMTGFSPDDTLEVQALAYWAIRMQVFLHRQNLKPSNTRGAIGAQLLCDPRFYPWPRRKVPRATNTRARLELPGNYYAVFTEYGTEHDGYYFDQKAAHHNCAASIVFPASDKLMALGRYHTLADKPGLAKGMAADVLKSYGLLYVKLAVPHIPPGMFPPPCADRPGRHTAYVFTNELETLHRLGVRIEYVIAAWVSPARDRGLNAYAKWSLEQLQEVSTTDRRWLKPTLLATYGVLASRPRIHRTGWRQATGGTPCKYPIGAGYIDVIEHTLPETEPRFTNVIHRGMIEAETRLRSLSCARRFTSMKLDVLAIYADGVIISAYDKDSATNIDPPLPLEGWQLEADLTRLRFLNDVSFTSDQVTKLPGVPGRDVVLGASMGRVGGPHTGRKPARIPLDPSVKPDTTGTNTTQESDT